MASGSRGHALGSPIRSLTRPTIFRSRSPSEPGGQPKALAQVVPQDDVPAPKELRRQKVGEAAVRPSCPCFLADQVVHVAVQHEQARRTGEVLLGKLACPARKPRERPRAALSPGNGATLAVVAG